MPDGHPIFKGHNVDTSNSIDSVIKLVLQTGFQRTNLGRAVEEVCRMRAWRLSNAPWEEGDDEALRDPSI